MRNHDIPTTRSNLIAHALVAVLSAVFTTAAFAAGGLSTGAAEAEISRITNWLIGVVGLVAVGYLTFVGFKCWSGRADWVHDFGEAVLKIVATGAAGGIAVYAYSFFSGR